MHRRIANASGFPLARRALLLDEFSDRHPQLMFFSNELQLIPKRADVACLWRLGVLQQPFVNVVRIAVGRKRFAMPENLFQPLPACRHQTASELERAPFEDRRDDQPGR